jgi:hypothetical protein
LKAIRAELKATQRAKPQPARLHPHASTGDVLRVMAAVEAGLTELRPILWQWQANMDRLGAERLAEQTKRPRLAPRD